MLCKVIAHRLVVQWVNIKISYLLLFCWLSIFEAVESVQSSGVGVNLAASYLSSTFFGRRYSASVLKPLKAEIEASFSGKISSTKQNRNQASLVKSIIEKH